MPIVTIICLKRTNKPLTALKKEITIVIEIGTKMW